MSKLPHIDDKPQAARRPAPPASRGQGSGTEKRYFNSTVPTATGRRVSGYAARFNKRSRNLGGRDPWYEIILPGSMPPLEKQDVRALWNHDPKQLLARSKFGKGTLKLSIDAVGLKYEFDAPQSTIGNDLLESIKRGDLDESSFSFSVAKSGDAWSEEDGVRIRRISKIAALYDISPVTEGAYADTSVSARKASTPQSAAAQEVEDWKLRLRLL